MKELFTVRQAAAFLGMTQTDVDVMIRNGQLRAWRMPQGKELLIKKQDLINRAHENRAQPPAVGPEGTG